jgi:hypothetical protein
MRAPSIWLCCGRNLDSIAECYGASQPYAAVQYSTVVLLYSTVTRTRAETRIEQGLYASIRRAQPADRRLELEICHKLLVLLLCMALLKSDSTHALYMCCDLVDSDSVDVCVTVK